jgi:hypothetical protein
MAMYVEGRPLANEAEPFGLLTEGTAGVAVIVLAVIALAGVSAHVLASIAAIVIGVGLMVQAFNSAAERAKAMTRDTAAAQMTEFGSEVLVDFVSGLAGIVLGILALVGTGATHLLPAALIIYGGGLLMSGAVGARSPGSFTASAMEVLLGLAAIVLGILSVLMAGSPVLVLVGFLVVGTALLLVSATFSGAVLQFFRAA